MKPVKRDQIWEVLRGGGEWCEAHVINVVSNRVNLHSGMTMTQPRVTR